MLPESVFSTMSGFGSPSPHLPSAARERARRTSTGMPLPRKTIVFSGNVSDTVTILCVFVSMYDTVAVSLPITSSSRGLTNIFCHSVFALPPLTTSA